MAKQMWYTRSLEFYSAIKIGIQFVHTACMLFKVTIYFVKIGHIKRIYNSWIYLRKTSKNCKKPVMT